MEAAAIFAEPAEKSELEALLELILEGAHLHVVTDSGEELALPKSAIEILERALTNFQQGDGVQIAQHVQELTTQQAADALNVSRPYLIGLLDDGKIAYRLVGTHRRVDAKSFYAYAAAEQSQRRAVADELSRETYELGFA